MIRRKINFYQKKKNILKIYKYVFIIYKHSVFTRNKLPTSFSEDTYRRYTCRTRRKHDESEYEYCRTRATHDGRCQSK